MYCTKCGAKLRDGAKFCHVCGKPVAAVKQTPPAAVAGNQTVADAKGGEKVRSDKTTFKTEIKEKAVDLAKAGARQILSALKDGDINASAAPGEVSCKPDAAQSAFMKMLKKGLMALAVLLCLPLSLGAKTDLSKKLGPFSLKWGDDLTVSYSIEFEGASVSGNYFRSDIQYLSENGKLVKDNINGYFSKEYVTVRLKAAPMSLPDEYKDLGYSATAKYGKWGSLSEKEKQTSGWKPLSQGIDAVFRIPVTDKESLLDMVVSIGLRFDGYISWSARSHDFFLAYGKSGDGIIDTIAGGDSDENGWVVPAAVIGGLAVGGIALKWRRKKKTAKKSDKSPKNEEKSDDKRDDDDEETATYEMRIRKDFGDTLTPGGSAQKVYARIVRIPQGEKASTDTPLTSKIFITGDDYLNVSGQSLAGDYMSASVEAPQSGSIPDEAVVNFRLAGAGGSFTNRMHFKIAKSEIIFFHLNFPAHSTPKSYGSFTKAET